MTGDAITRHLTARNGGPGITDTQLAEALGVPRAIVRNELARLVYKHKTVTCDIDGRYLIGDPRALLGAR